MAAVHQRGGDHEICGGSVAGNRDIADDRDSEQGLDVRVMRMWLQRIPQEHQQVDLALGDAGANPLVLVSLAKNHASND